MKPKKATRTNEPLTKSEALSLRHRGPRLTPAQQRVITYGLGDHDPARCRLEELMQDLTLDEARMMEGRTPEQVRQLLFMELDADEVRELLDTY